jgi:hypothetical protein
LDHTRRRTIMEMKPNRDSETRGTNSSWIRGLTIGCRGCGALHAFSWRTVLRGGPAPLTLVSLGRWTSIAGGSRSISSGASMSDLLTTCVECGGKVSTAAQSCRVCGKKPKGVRCVLCNKPMPERDVFKTRVPHEMSYSHEGAHRRYGSISVHKHCWERLVAELFPETSLRGSCPACGLGRNRPESTEVGFPSECNTIHFVYLRCYLGPEPLV